LSKKYYQKNFFFISQNWNIVFIFYIKNNLYVKFQINRERRSFGSPIKEEDSIRADFSTLQIQFHENLYFEVHYIQFEWFELKWNDGVTIIYLYIYSEINILNFKCIFIFYSSFDSSVSDQKAASISYSG